MELLRDTPQQTSIGNGHLFCEITKSQAHFQHKKTPTLDGRTVGQGQFTLFLDVIALQEPVFIPLSLASGKKPTGFIYHIEGTAEGVISAAKISCKGDDVTQITLGTLLYVKIPTGRTAHFRMVFDITGSLGKLYTIGINRINYKLNPSDVRYKRFDTKIETKTLKFR